MQLGRDFMHLIVLGRLGIKNRERLEVDDRLYATWTGVVADVRDLMDGKRGLGLRELATAISPELLPLVAIGFISLASRYARRRRALTK